MDDDIKSAFGHRLRHTIKQHDMTQAAFAESVGIPPSTMQEYLKGRMIPSMTTITRIADGLDVSIDFLIRGSEHGLKWREATESLPPVYVNSLVFAVNRVTSQASVFIAFRIPTESGWWTVDHRRFAQNETRSNDVGRVSTDWGIRYWMPLPPPPNS